MLTPAYDLDTESMSSDCVDNILKDFDVDTESRDRAPIIKLESTVSGALDVPEYSLSRNCDMYDECVVPQNFDYASDTDGSVAADDYAVSPSVGIEASKFEFTSVPSSPPISPREVDTHSLSFVWGQDCIAPAHDISFPSTANNSIGYDLSLPGTDGAMAVPLTSTHSLALTTAGTLSGDGTMYDQENHCGWPGVSVTSEEQLQQLIIQQFASHFHKSNPSRRKSLQQDVCDYLQYATGEHDKINQSTMDFLTSSIPPLSAHLPISSAPHRENTMNAVSGTTAGSNATITGVAPPEHCKGTGEGGWDLTLLNMSTVDLNRWLKSADLSKEQMCVLKTTRRRIKNRKYTQKSRARRAHDKVVSKH